MSRYWNKLVAGLSPYVPGEQPQLDNLIKLNTNESPFDPAPGVLEAISAVSGEQLRRYPDPESSALKQAFATRHGLAANQVFLGNGSDEVLAHTFQALLGHGKPVCYPDISYSFYPVWCELYQLKSQPVPLSDGFTIDVSQYPQSNGGIIIPNPNAPTGVLLPLDSIRALLQAQKNSVVVIDEAYIDFGGASAVELIDDYDNLLVIQTLSKSRALAGLRVGVAMAHADLITALERVKNSFNSYPLDTLAQAASLASLADEGYFQRCCTGVIESRERLSAALTQMDFEVLPSAANFVFARHRQRDAESIFQALRERGIIVRYFSAPRIDQFLRISIGTDDQCDSLVSALKEILN